MGGVIDYLPTDLMLGTNPGSRIAYETPLYVVPMSNARTNFLEGPVYGERVVTMPGRLEMLEERHYDQKLIFYKPNGGPPHFSFDSHSGRDTPTWNHLFEARGT